MYTKIRKNAKNKIVALAMQATKITLKEMHSQIDDSFEPSYCAGLTVEQVLEFMATNYSDLVVRQYDDSEGNISKVEIIDGEYYFCDRIILTFSPLTRSEELTKFGSIEVEQVEEITKPKISLSMVQAYLAKGFISPLTHGVKAISQSNIEAVKTIVSVNVEMAECNAIESGVELTLAEFQRQAWVRLLKHREYIRAEKEQDYNYGYGYDKIYLTVTTLAGNKVKFRFDLALKRNDLQAYFSDYVDWCLEEEAAQATTH